MTDTLPPLWATLLGIGLIFTVSIGLIMAVLLLTARILRDNLMPINHDPEHTNDYHEEHP